MDFLQRQNSLLFVRASKPVLGSTQPPVEWVTVARSVGAKRPVREADYSHPVSDEGKNHWSCNSANPGVVLHQAEVGDFTVLFVPC